MIKTCAICSTPTYDADPIVVETFDHPPRRLRIWLCSPDCAWQAGRLSALHCLSRPTLGTLQSVFKADGLEVLE